MGCDAHAFVETRTFRNKRDKKINEVFEDYSDEMLEWEVIGEEGSYYSERNYYVFSLLADVRNYDEGVRVISEPRGIPEDASEQYKKYCDGWNGDGHSHSYYTLSELLTVDFSEYDQESIQSIYKLIDSMKSLKEKSSISDDDVRFVFLFDN